MKDFKHVLSITAIVFAFMGLTSLIPINLGVLNPFKKSASDYESTDLIFCKFKDQVNYDDRIVILNSGKPKRSELAKALFTLDSLEANIIGVDIIFEKPIENKEDSLLANVINGLDNIVLADRFIVEKDHSLPHECSKDFCNENFGYTNFVAKPDHSIRFYSPFIDHVDVNYASFSSEVVRQAAIDKFNILKSRQNRVERIHYRGSEDSYTQIEIDDLIANPMKYKEAIKDKIVLVGYMGEDKWEESTKDKFYTPVNPKMAMKTVPDMFGIAIHANIISMVLDEEFIYESSYFLNIVVAIIITIFVVTLFRHIYLTINPGYWKLVRFLQLGIFFILFIISTFLFYIFHIKLNLSAALIAVVLSWDFTKIYENVFIRKQKFFKPKN